MHSYSRDPNEISFYLYHKCNPTHFFRYQPCLVRLYKCFPCFLCSFFSMFGGVFLEVYMYLLKHYSNSVLSSTSRWNMAFFRALAVRFYIFKCFLYARLVFFMHGCKYGSYHAFVNFTWKQDIRNCKITCVIIIYAKNIMWGFGYLPT